MQVMPFRGLRPRADLVDRIPSLPYDVVSTDEARALAQGNPHSFLHVIRAEIDLDPGVDVHDDRVYAKAVENYRAMRDQGWIVRDDSPAYYVYRLRHGDHVQTGIVGAAAVEDYVAGRIKKHEFTRPDKERDRARLVDDLSAHPGPIFLTHRPSADLQAIVEHTTEAAPDAALAAPDGVEHQLWVVDDPGRTRQIEACFRELPATYVADGHHRTAAAATVSTRRIAQHGGQGRGQEPYRYFLAVHFPSTELKVLDYNRVIRGLPDMTPDQFRERLAEAGFEVQAHPDRRPPRRGTVGMYLAGRWELLTPGAPETAGSSVVDGLDVSVLNGRVILPLLQIADQRTDPRIDFVGGIRGMDELERRVDSGAATLAFALFPTSLDEVMQVADAGAIMPPKSTWFEPKLRSGLVIQTIEGESL